jgi:hypothetical protein
MNNKLKELSAYCGRQKHCSKCPIALACQRYFKVKPELWESLILASTSERTLGELTQLVTMGTLRAGPVQKVNRPGEYK